MSGNDRSLKALRQKVFCLVDTLGSMSGFPLTSPDIVVHNSQDLHRDDLESWFALGKDYSGLTGIKGPIQLTVLGK